MQMETNSAATAAPFMTLNELLTTFDGDVDFVKELATMFLERAPSMFDELQALVGDGKGLAASRAAHKLKGMTGYFARGTAYTAAATIEATAPSDPDSARTALGPLGRSIHDLCQHLSTEVLHA